jgi:hypothetical protein
LDRQAMLVSQPFNPHKWPPISNGEPFAQEFFVKDH